MQELILRPKSDSPLKVLCMGAHSDDIEIGCGGTILTLLEKYPAASVHWIVFSSDQQRANEARDSAEMFLKPAQSRHVLIKNFRDSFFPYVGDVIKESFEQIKCECSPDIIFTHYRNDLHQDHRLISELTWNTFRNHMILEYEVPKYDGDLGNPNCFVHLEERICEEKIRLVLNHFRSQNPKPWFDYETFISLLRLRGMQCNAASKYAEAFYSRKMTLQFGSEGCWPSGLERGSRVARHLGRNEDPRDR